MQDNLNFGEYAYNWHGVPITAGVPPMLGLGLFPFEEGNVSESLLVMPSDLVVIGDAYCEPDKDSLDTGLTVMQGYQYGDSSEQERARMSARARHTGVFTLLFCDGHVQHLKPSKLFGQTADALQRLNNDHQAHADVVAHDFWQIIND